MKINISCWLFITCVLTINFSFADDSSEQTTFSSLAVDNVWSAHRIKPYLLTRGKNQFVAYYDANRQMTIAHRELGKVWRYYKVDSWLGWDSHNYVTMELDKTGNLHVMGNMHADPIEYFRTREPFQVRSLERVPVMVNKDQEQRSTYPVFMRNSNDELLVKYRNGGSGNGDEIYNIYNTESKTWSRLHSNQFLDGEGLMSAYFEGPVLGPDGQFHLIWVWRNTPNAATNHSLSYAKSADLVNWTDSNNSPIALPITLAKAEVVDPVPPFNGIINGNIKLGFDHNGAVVITYHKYDEQGNTQFYLARKKSDGWQQSKISDWKDFRWEFGGHGSLGRFRVEPFSISTFDSTNLGVLVRKEDQILRFVVDGESLKTLRVEQANLYPPAIESVTQDSNKVLLNTADLPLEHRVFEGVGEGKYYLSWLSQPGNRDRAHTYISIPSTLLLHDFTQ